MSSIIVESPRGCRAQGECVLRGWKQGGATTRKVETQKMLISKETGQCFRTMQGILRYALRIPAEWPILASFSKTSHH